MKSAKQPKQRTTAVEEFRRVSAMLSGLTINASIMLISDRQVSLMEASGAQDALMKSLVNELRNHLRAIKGPEDYERMSQAYEAFSEASFCFALKSKGIDLLRTPGTGQNQQKRPDFLHQHSSGPIYFEVKALDISDRLFRYKEMAYGALDAAAELDERAKDPGIHVGKPIEVSGHLYTSTLRERIDGTIERISNTIKPEQLKFGPTVLVVDLGRLQGLDQGPSGITPVFFHDAPPAESCVSGELWQIALGLAGEQLYEMPRWDGESNLGGHQAATGVLHQNISLLGISFLLPRWSSAPELFTIWNLHPDLSELENPLTLSESELDDLLTSISSGINDSKNERGWFYRIVPLRP